MSWYSCMIIITLVIYAVLLYGSSIYGFIRAYPLTATSRKLLYSLSLTMYGSAWVFFGMAEKSNHPLWDILPLFLGPFIIFIFFYRIFSKILIISQQENVTSIPDFIAKRYGNSRLLAILVSLLYVLAFTPYITLQIKALIDIISLVLQQSDFYSVETEIYLTLIVLLSLGLLIVIIAGRQANIVEYQYKSLLFTCATGAILKLIAFIMVGLLACKLLYQGLDYHGQTFTFATFQQVFINDKPNIPDLVVQILTVMIAIICLPNIFQTGATKAQKTQDLATIHWFLPLYFLLVIACIIPIIIVGNLITPSIGQNYWLITLPIQKSSTLFTLITLLGGFAAIVGTTIACCFALSRMVTNHILINCQSNILSKVSFSQLQALRWLSIILILALAMGCYMCLSVNIPLNTIGLVAFAGIIQLIPAMTGALYWKLASKLAVIIGLLVGTGIWFATLFLPLLLHQTLDKFVTASLLEWLQLLLPFKLSYINFCTAISLLSNFCCFIFFSLLSKKRVTEHWQATKFINQDSTLPANNLFVVKLEDLILLVSRFIGEKKTLELFTDFAQKREISLEPSSRADQQWIFYTEHLLAERLGSYTARAMVKSALEGRDMQMEDVFLIVDEASEVLHFNRMLLQGALEHITQGISVIDKSLHLVAWNKRYVDLFDYPEGFIQVGRPIADIIYYNAKRGMCGKGNPEEHVIKRLSWLSLGQSHTSERLFPNGRVIEMIGNPMPGGGFVTSFTDITAFRQAEQSLQQINESLEQRVKERTKKLSELNTALVEAKSYAEQANESKTRFLAAVSHDLMQPLNAARLFSASLSQELLPNTARDLVNHLESSLHSAEELISDLLDMSRLESGRITPKVQVVALNDLFDTLNMELSALTPKDITFKVHNCSLFVKTDGKLLRRIIQNFLTNAFRYGDGRVVLGARRLKGQVRIEVWDQGPGIPKDKQKVIFEEFKRLDSHQTRAEKGLGLGLAIADGFCKLLNHSLSVNSWLGKGSVFSVTVPIDETPLILNTTQLDEMLRETSNIDLKENSDINILCVDNEQSILTGMETLLSRWGCQVITALNQQQCTQALAKGIKPQLLLIDYHLDDGYTGIELIQWLREQLHDPLLPAIIISAHYSPDVIEKITAARLEQIRKPIKPAALRALISRYVSLK